MLYTLFVPEKKGNGFDRLITHIHKQEWRNAVSVLFVLVRSQWVAMARKLSGLLVYLYVCQSINLIICRPPPFDRGKKFTHTLQKDYVKYHSALKKPNYV